MTDVTTDDTSIFLGLQKNYLIFHNIYKPNLMFNNPLDNDTYADNFISNNANLIDSNNDIITPNNLEFNSVSNAIDSLLIAQDLGTLSERQQFQGNVSPIDSEDLYHFTTDKIGDLDYRLTLSLIHI